MINYTNREIDLMFEPIHNKLDKILIQTTKHNGRLSKLEKFMYTLTGAIIIFGSLQFDKILSLFK